MKNVTNIRIRVIIAGKNIHVKKRKSAKKQYVKNAVMEKMVKMD
jgi:hypothetical protein